jgi:hypothetical protein
MLHADFIPFTTSGKTWLPAGQPRTTTLLDWAHASSASAEPELALTRAQARCLLASLCGLHCVPMDAALLTEQLVPPISLGKVMALLPALGIEARVLQPKQLVAALQPGRVLQVGLQKGVGTGAPLLISCQAPGRSHEGRNGSSYAWMSIAASADRGRHHGSALQHNSHTLGDCQISPLAP